MNLTENARGATPLDGHFYVELAQQSGGYMNEASLHPEEDIMNAMMARRKAYRDMRMKRKANPLKCNDYEHEQIEK